MHNQTNNTINDAYFSIHLTYEHVPCMAHSHNIIVHTQQTPMVLMYGSELRQFVILASFALKLVARIIAGQRTQRNTDPYSSLYVVCCKATKNVSEILGKNNCWHRLG